MLILAKWFIHVGKRANNRSIVSFDYFHFFSFNFYVFVVADATCFTHNSLSFNGFFFNKHEQLLFIQ